MSDTELFSGTTDSSFLRQVQSGDEDAWQRFYSRYSEMIRQIGARRHLSHADCQDLHSEVMTIFWRKMDSYIYDRCRGSFRGFLAGIAESAAGRLFQRKTSGNDLPGEEIDYPPEVDRIYMDEWRDFLLQKVIGDLKQIVDTETYQVFYMSVVQERPIRDVAAVTRKTPNNIYVIRYRCLRKLRQLVQSYSQREAAPPDSNSQRNI